MTETALAHFGSAAGTSGGSSTTTSASGSGSASTLTSTTSTTTATVTTGKSRSLYPTSSTSSNAPSSSLLSHRQRDNSSRLPRSGFAPINSAEPTTLASSSRPLQLPRPAAHPQLTSPTAVSAHPPSTPKSSPREQPGPPSSATRQSKDTASSTASAPSSRSSLRSRRSTSSSTPSLSNLDTLGEGAALQTSPPPSSKPAAAHLATRRAPAAYSAIGVAASGGPPQALSTQRLQSTGTPDYASQVSTPELPTSEWANGQLELLLPKTLSQSSLPSSPDDDRRTTSHYPPVSSRRSLNNIGAQPGISTPVRVPPIRAFRSSGSRKSVALDMNFTPRPYHMGPEYADSNNEDTLRSLQGRRGQEPPINRPSSARREAAVVDEGDVFLRIAGEDSARRGLDSTGPEDTQGVAVPVSSTSPC